MYRDDFLANAIYGRARDWTRASFFLATLLRPLHGPCEIHFTNGVVMDAESTVVGAMKQGRELEMLFCDLEPRLPWPHHAEVLLYFRSGYESPANSIVGWTYVSGGVDAEKSKIKLNDRTDGIQRQLNRLRMREQILLTGMARRSWETAPLFTPDMSEIAKAAGVPESTVRGFFEGRATRPEAREKILLAFNMRPEELETKLWESGS
jgi:hypothetical protein